ncbi:MAG TPA: alpha/beta fold hydrolase, partial [Actinomycetota bacterium]|nr:alpha/beta fold hydrolase [Actinomycetota bacterium]
PELVDVDLGHVVQHLRAPTLVLVGEHDRVTPVRAARALAEALPDGRLEIVRGAGHIPMLERPEEVTAAIRAFAEDRFA